jgi:hypothetical protein
MTEKIFQINQIIIKREKKKKLWYDNECEVKYRHVQNLARNLSNNPWDKNLRQKVALNKKKNLTN